jgi:hypothetical protein
MLQQIREDVRVEEIALRHALQIHRLGRRVFDLGEALL